MNLNVVMALIATLCTWLITALGAATVIFFKETKEKTLNLMLGFAAGVMIAASFWSLLQPAIKQAEIYLSTPPWLVVSVGFLLGAFFMWLSDKAVAYAESKFKIHYIKAAAETTNLSNDTNLKNINCDNPKTQGGVNRIILLVLSITLHNIPEGLAVGVAFGSLSQNFSAEALMCAVTIAVGIGLQNFPEGAAVSLPLRREGFSRRKSFLIGQASAIVEPIAGVIGAATVVYIQNILPYALAFAAGAMILVAVHELIPECQKNRNGDPYFATMGIVAGFTIMMLLDVALG